MGADVNLRANTIHANIPFANFLCRTSRQSHNAVLTRCICCVEFAALKTCYTRRVDWGSSYSLASGSVRTLELHTNRATRGDAFELMFEAPHDTLEVNI
jgi:hypothetical protein